ncbi:hypothetical protein ACFQ3J_00335 [Paenibacillus provencensis]|uniref:Phage protein n=1 Tax=Paenibacillus provencensis TaxID=441151 RepID=A0ABW3PXI1_9BACL|nr:hypothetical protein [Paenibacillus sp. MER 78]MCM3130959.1 hypothetical protein [Paenibacillus sp. MER 78]
MKYRKKPVVIEAFVYGTSRPDWFDDAVSADTIRTYKSSPDEGPFVRGQGLYCIIKTLEGSMRADEGDYIIQGVDGEIYPCKAYIFEQTYEKVE